MKLQTKPKPFCGAADCVGVQWKMQPQRSFSLSVSASSESNCVGIRLFWSAA